jgi:hypothetical protein
MVTALEQEFMTRDGSTAVSCGTWQGMVSGLQVGSKKMPSQGRMGLGVGKP